MRRSKAGASPAARTIFRNGSPERPFTMICNSALRDTDLSPAQLTVLVFMLSQPPTFQASLERVAELRGLGRDQVREAVLGSRKRPGLIDLGYCMRRRERNPDTKQFGPWQYLFTDQRGMFASSTDFPQEIHSDQGPRPENQGLEGGPRPETHALESRAHIKKISQTTPQTPNSPFAAGTPAGDAPIPFDGVEASEERGFSRGGYATDAPTTDLGTSPRARYGEHLEVFGVHQTLLGPADDAARERGTYRGGQAEPIAPELEARTWFPFSAAVLVQIRKLALDPEEILLRYFAHTKGRRIANPDGYLLRIAIDVAARRRGVPLADVAREIRAHRASAAEQMAELAIAPKVGVRASDALRAQLARGRR